MEPYCFLDTNVFVRYLAGDHEEHTAIAQTMIQAIEAGHTIVESSDTAIFETLFTMSSRYKADRVELAASLAALLSLDGIRLPTKRRLLEALDLWTSFRRLSFADAYHLILTAHTPRRTIASFDQGLDRCLPDVSRVEQLP